MKAILMLDEMPKDCVQCPCCMWYEIIDGKTMYAKCLKEQKEMKAKFEDDYFITLSIPKWCPLIEINDNIAKLVEVAR